jgi:ABC-2 type transport system permease protein
MMRSLSTIFWLSLKEIRSFLGDWVLLGLVLYTFSLAIIAQAQSNSQELRNASLGVVDEDGSTLSHRIVAAFLPPYFKPPEPVAQGDVDRLMNTGRYTFILDIPPHFQRDVAAERSPTLQVLVDATAMMQAGIGAGYAQQIINTEVADFVRHARPPGQPADLAVRIAFNPNITTAWFTSVMGVITNVTMLGIILAGAAVVREREHGTMDHLLVMPVTPFEIAMAKILGNTAVPAAAVALSLSLVVRQLLQVPIEGSITLFMAGVAIYLFFAMSIGIFLATIARTMPQLGLLFMLVAIPLNMLSGANTPLESMPPLLRSVMENSPTTHFVSFAQGILYRGAGLDLVWREFVEVAVAGGIFFALGLLRFRRAAFAN